MIEPHALLRQADESAVARDVVVLDRVEPGWVPPYCTHGKATCVGGCGEWVWLGTETFEVVSSGTYLPLCQQCAGRLIPPGRRADSRLEDHLRISGPHGEQGASR